jgi:L-serine/L-threonine ammonia-lyase
MLVEPACGAALAMIYSDRLREHYFGPLSSSFNNTNTNNTNTGPIVIEICGGNGVNIDLLRIWKEEYHV